MLGKRRGEIVGVDGLVRHDQRRRRALEIVLREERADHVAAGALLRVLREEALVAEVPAVADHHQIDARDALVERARDHVRVERLRGVDVLPALDFRQRLDLVAVDGRLLVVAGIRGRLHPRGEGGHHVVLAAVHEESRVPHVGIVPRRVDQPDTGRRAAPDLVQQAGTRPVAEHRVLAGPKAKHLLQRLDALAHRAGIRERPVERVLAVERPAMEAEPRKPVAGDHQVRIGLVVAEEDVVARRKRLDQVAFEEERLPLRARHRDLDGPDLGEHDLRARTVVALLEVRRDPFPQIARLADVEHVAGGVEHPVHAGQVGQAGDEGRGVKHGVAWQRAAGCAVR